MVCFPVVKIVKYWKKIDRDILKYPSWEAYGRLDKSREDDILLLGCGRDKIPSDYFKLSHFPDLTSFSLQSTYFMIAERNDK